MIEAANLLCRPITCQRHMGIQKHDANSVIQRTIKKIYHAVSPVMQFHSPGESAKKDFLLIQICFYMLYFSHTKWIYWLVASHLKELPNSDVRKGVNVWVMVARRLVKFLMRQCADTKNPQVCRLLTTVTVSVMTPAHSVNFLPSDLFTSAFFISACCQWIAYSQNCVTKYYKHLFSFFAKGKKTPQKYPQSGFWISLCLCRVLGAA